MSRTCTQKVVVREACLESLGFRMLRESEICAMPCDKEGLFCTMPTTVPFLLHKGVLETSGYYEECDPEELHESSALKGYRSLSRRISKLEPDQSSQAAWLLQIIVRGVVIVGSTVT